MDTGEKRRKLGLSIPALPMKTKLLFAAASVAIAALCVGYRSWHRPVALTSEDYLLVGDLANDSGEKDFDGSIREALRISLAQSPLLNLLSEEKTRTVLRKMGKPAGQRLDSTLAAALCGPLGARAYLTGKISRAGESYSVELQVLHCADNARMARRPPCRVRGGAGGSRRAFLLRP